MEGSPKEQDDATTNTLRPNTPSTDRCHKSPARIVHHVTKSGEAFFRTSYIRTLTRDTAQENDPPTKDHWEGWR